MKFFKKTPEKCSVCNQEKIIFKKMKSGGIELKYCKTCYDEYFKRVEDRVKTQINEMVKAGRKIGMKEAMDLTKQITAEIEAEQAQEIIEQSEKMCPICGLNFKTNEELGDHLISNHGAPKETIVPKTKEEIDILVKEKWSDISENGKDSI